GRLGRSAFPTDRRRVLHHSRTAIGRAARVPARTWRGDVMTPERRAGVMGWPVAHSKSPRLHGYWLRHYRIAGSYVHLPVAPEDLARDLRALPERGFAGINVTVPHKEAVLTLADDVTAEARRIGAANTVFVEGTRLRATNTDAYGFMANLRAGAPSFDPAAGPAVVIGAGGAARAVCYALR